MKTTFRSATYALYFIVTLAMLTATQAATAFFTVAHTNPVLCDSYPKINVTTTANLLALDSKAQEELWVKRILMGADQENIFYDNMIGAPGSGKPFIRQDDFNKVDGNTIHIPTWAPLGGPGAQGESERTGNEEKMRISSFPVRIGRQWYGVAITDVSKEETVVGSQFDNMANILLRKRIGKKKTEDMLMTLKASATSSNIVRPNFKTTRESLKSADTVGTTTITRSGLTLSGLGGIPTKLGKSKTGADVEMYLFFGHQYGLASLKSEAAYLQALRDAGLRGDSNALFKGDFTDWDGHGIYRWYLKDHDAYGPVGSTLLPRAFLGAAIAADDTAPVIYGGGDATGATILPAPNYFEFFSNSPYTFTNGNTIAADTSTVRYIAIMNLTGANAGKIGFYSYQINNANTLQVVNRLRAAAAGASVTTLGNITWNVGPWVAAGAGNFAGLTDNHPIGSLILEVNSFGVPFGGSLMLGEAAGICGHGRLKGRNAMAARTYEVRNHGMDHGVGVETVYGTAATKRTDGKTPNYVYVESAVAYDGFPAVT